MMSRKSWKGEGGATIPYVTSTYSAKPLHRPGLMLGLGIQGLGDEMG